MLPHSLPIHAHTSLPLIPLLCSQLFALISEKRLLDEVIIAFLNDFMLRHTVTLNHSPLNPRECVLWREMRQKQYDKLHRTLFFDIKVHFHISLPCTHRVLTPSVSSFDSQTKCGWVKLVPASTNLLLPGCEGIAVADTEPAASPANRITEAARTSVSEYLFRINPPGREGGREGGGGTAPMHEDYCF